MSAEKNIEIFNSYESDWEETRNRQIKHVNFYRGRQYSRADSRKLRAMGIKPITINLVRPLLSQQASMLTSSRPTWKVVPIQGASKRIAEIAQRLLVGKWNSDYVDIEYDRAVLDMLIEGIGYLFIDLASFLENSTFDINIQRLNWKYVYPDPNASRFDLSDAENIVIKKKVGMQYAQVKFRMSESQVKDAMGDVISVNPMSTQIQVLDRFSKYPAERIIYKIKPDNAGNYPELHDMPPSIFYTTKLRKTVEQEKRRWYKDLKVMEAEGKVDLTLLKELNIYRCISVGHNVAYEGVMNIRDYPVIPLVNELIDEVTKVDSEVTFIEGIQEAMNKFYMLTIHNAMLTGNVRFMAPEGSVTNKAQFQRTSALPGATLEWKPQPDLGGGANFGKPEVIQPGNLSPAFYTLSQDLQKKAEYQLSMYAPVRGDAQQSPETFSTTASLQDFGSQRVKRLARRLDIMLAKAGEVMIQFFQNYADVNEMVSFVEDKQYQDNGTVNENFGIMQETPPVNIPSEEGEKDEEGNIVSQFKDDTRIGQYSVKVLTQPNLGTDRLIKAGFMSNMVMNKALPALPSVMSTIFDNMEIPGYQKIIQEMTAKMPNQKMIVNLMKQLKVGQKQIEFLHKQSIEMAKKLEISDFRNELDKKLRDIAEHTKGAVSELKDSLVQQAEDMAGEQGNGQES